MPVPAIDLTDNPFYQLRVSPRDGLDRLAEAAEEAEASGTRPADVVRGARRQLATSRSRLEAELRWLPGVHPKAADLVVHALAQKNPAKAREVLPQLPGLARANVAAHLCGLGLGDPPLDDLINAQALIAADDILTRINADRGAAAMPMVTTELVAGGLDELLDGHARAAVQAVLPRTDPSDALVSILKENREDRGRIRALLERIVERFDAEVAPRLSSAEEQVEAAAKAVRARSADTAGLERLMAGTALWARLTMPRRAMVSRLGVDDKRSSEFLTRQRDLCLWLANDESQHASALDLTRMLASAFADQKGWAGKLAGDIAVLEDHLDGERSEEILEPLQQAVDTARQSISATIASLLRDGFAAGSAGIAGELYRAFAGATAQSSSLGSDRDLPWLLVRSIAINLNNEHRRPDAALVLVDGLLHYSAKPSPDALAKLQLDQSTLTRERGLARVETAISAGRLFEAKNLLQRLIGDEKDPSQRKKLEGIGRSIAAREQRTARRVRLGIGWSIAAIVVVLFVINQNNQSPRYGGYTPPTYSPPPPHYSAPSPPSGYASPPPLAPPAIAPVGMEEMPPIQTGQLLSRGQIRWCQFQDERLEAARGLIASADQVRRFNELVDDWNGRCSSYRYQRPDLEAVNGERSRSIDRLRGEGARLLANRGPATAPGTIGPGAPLIAARPPVQPPPVQLGPIESGQRVLSTTQSDDVRVLQDRLRELGFFVGRSTGTYGPVTQSALREWRRRNGYSDTAVWNAEVQRDLFRGTGR